MQIKTHLAGAALALGVLFSGGFAVAGGHTGFDGLYVGANFGALGISGTETDTHTVPPRVYEFSGGPDWAVMGGVVAGYDFLPAQNILFGGFVELDFSNASFNLIAPDGDLNIFEAGTIFNIGARLGLLVSDTTLLYGTGGYSSGEFEYTYAKGASDQYINTRTFTGWFIGAGAEQQLSGPWSAKLEYRYTSYGDQQVGAGTGGGPAPVDMVTRDMNADTHAIRLGINFSFNAPQ